MSEAGNVAPGNARPKGSPQLIILLIVVVGPSLLIGTLFGAGGAAIIGGFIALFSLISSMGGSLRANLARFAFVGPLIGFGAVAPRLLADVSIPAAIALATVMVFIAGLLPLRGRRYDGTALGLGMGVLFGYSMPLGAVTAWQLVATALAGLLVTFLMLLLTGLKDPSGPTRSAVAGLLDEKSEDFAAAVDAWTTDRAPRWLGTVLLNAGRYRLARSVVSSGTDPDGRQAEVLDIAAKRATTIADSIRSASPGEKGDLAAVISSPALLTSTPAVSVMLAALTDAEQAAIQRDVSRTPIPRKLRTRVSTQSVRAAVGYGEVQFRHAIRTSVAVLVALLVSLFLERGDPLTPTLLMTTFGIVQVSWHATLNRARDRFAGIVVGGIVVLLVLLFLPEPFLFPFSMIGLAVGMWFITARPAIGTAGLIAMSVGLNSELRNLEPFSVVTEYIVLTVIALLVGTVIGFVIVPAWRPPAVEIRVQTAVDQTVVAIFALSETSKPGVADHKLQSVANGQAAIKQLVPDQEKLTTLQREELEEFRKVILDLLVTAIFLTAIPPITNEHLLREAAVLLSAGHSDGAVLVDGLHSEEAVLLLAEKTVTQRGRLESALR